MQWLNSPEISLVERPVLINKGIRDGNLLAGFALFFSTLFRIFEITSARAKKNYFLALGRKK
jgi:hypothetical protein